MEKKKCFYCGKGTGRVVSKNVKPFGKVSYHKNCKYKGFVLIGF